MWCVLSLVSQSSPTSTSSLTRPPKGNIAFLIRYAYGPSIDATRVAIPVIDIRGENKSEVGHKAAVIVHEDEGKFTTFVEKQVEWGANVVCGLTEKVDTIVAKVMMEGNKGFGDFSKA